VETPTTEEVYGLLDRHDDAGLSTVQQSDTSSFPSTQTLAVRTIVVILMLVALVKHLVCPVLPSFTHLA